MLPSNLLVLDYKEELAMILDEIREAAKLGRKDMVGELEADYDLLTGLLYYFGKGSHEYKVIKARIDKLHELINASKDVEEG